MKNNVELKILRPFGPPIAKFSLTSDLVTEINQYVDELVKNKEKSKKLDAGKDLAGQVNQEISFEKNFRDKHIVPILEDNVRAYIYANTKKKISKCLFKDIWVVRQFRDEYNPVHYHSGHISGVGYLKVPDDLGQASQKSKISNPNGQLEIIHGAKMFLSEANIRITPKVGDFYMFPHYTMHNVYPFKSSGERRSISFNAEIDENIANVYSG